MNPDCIVGRDAVATLIGHLERHPGCAVAGPRILNPDGSLEYSARAFPDHFTFLFNRYSLLTRWFPGNPWSRRYLLSDWDHSTVRDVDWLSGACLLVRREAIDRVGPMDETFFMYGEDLDWAYRVKKAGWKVVYHPQVVVRHIKRAASRRSQRAQFEFYRAMLIFYRKHFRATTPLWLHALVLAGLMAKGGRGLWQEIRQPLIPAQSR